MWRAMGKFKIKDALKLRAGNDVRLADVDPTATPGFSGDKDDLKSRFEHFDDELYDLQEKLFATARAAGDTPAAGDSGSDADSPAPSILVVLQGMDTSGKGGAIRHVLNLFDPQGTSTVSFGKPMEEELEHDFLWRIRKHDPEPGQIVAFDRSHYEDVLVQRVHEWVDEPEVERRFGAIRGYERELADNNVHIIKVFFHISKDFQKKNLLKRIEREDKHWKYDPGDIDERELWDDYMAAYEDAIRRTDEDWAPWYVIPTDNKKYARMALKFLLLNELRSLDLSWPGRDFDPEVERARLEESD